MFIRTKRIKGRDYAYLVQNSWTGNGARQKVSKYLGKVHSPERAFSKGIAEFLNIQDVDRHFSGRDFRALIDDLVKLELYNHRADDSFFVKDGELRHISGKNAILKLNGGFLCAETIRALHSYNAGQDDGYILANLITAAGLKVENDVFVRLFGKSRQSPEQPQSSQDFYY